MGKQKRLVYTYCIDTSALIDLKNKYGSPLSSRDIVWTKLEHMIGSGEIISHELVYKEIKKGDDELANWCKNYKYMFRKIDECQIREFKSIKSKYDQDYWKREIDRNSEWADPWIIALSICEDAIIITNESPTKSISIPTIANHFNIPTLTSDNFLKKIGII